MTGREELRQIKARHEYMESSKDTPRGMTLASPVMASLHADRAALLDALEASAAREETLREALKPFAFYAEQRARKPFKGMDDVINGIHVGTEWEAEIRLSHCEAARAALAETAP